MIQESITKGLTTPIYVMIAFLHLGFHVFDMCYEIVEEDTYLSSDYIGIKTEVVSPWNKTEVIMAGNY